MTLLHYIIVCIFVYIFVILVIATNSKRCYLCISGLLRKLMIACYSHLHYGERQRRKNSPDHVGTTLVHSSKKSSQSRLLFPKHSYLKFLGTVANWKWFDLDLETSKYLFWYCSGYTMFNLTSYSVRWVPFSCHNSNWKTLFLTQSKWIDMH